MLIVLHICLLLMSCDSGYPSLGDSETPIVVYDIKRSRKNFLKKRSFCLYKFDI